MDNIGLGFPTVIVPENNYISVIIQCIVFFIIICLVIYIIRLYFKNIELKKEPEKNQTEIEKNLTKIENLKKTFLKIGGIIFAVVILVTIILSNFY